MFNFRNFVILMMVGLIASQIAVSLGVCDAKSPYEIKHGKKPPAKK